MASSTYMEAAVSPLPPPSVRKRCAPQRFSEETFKCGANNKHTAGRDVDAGHTVVVWDGDHMKSKERYDVGRVEAAELQEGAAFIVEEAEEVMDSDVVESDEDSESDSDSEVEEWDSDASSESDEDSESDSESDE
jgi:hypothetical protein